MPFSGATGSAARGELGVEGCEFFGGFGGAPAPLGRRLEHPLVP